MFHRPTLIVGALAALLLVAGPGGCSSPTTPSSWPVKPPSAEQIATIRNSDLESLASQRYPPELGMKDLAGAFTPRSNLDWAALALAFATRVEEQKVWSGFGGEEPADLPQEAVDAALDAFKKAFSGNPGWALYDPLFRTYLGFVQVCEAPPPCQKQLSQISIRYRWSGLGTPVRHDVEIAATKGRYRAKITTGGWGSEKEGDNGIPPSGQAETREAEVDAGLVEALPSALADLVPVGSPFCLNWRTDDYPDWVVTLTFVDRTTLELVTNRSNCLVGGGPWQTSIAGQDYVQFSDAFMVAVYHLFQALDLPLGEPMGSVCGGDTVFDKAFPIGP
jgi:hypothetical protein